jgi:hypothetical protein
LTGTLTIKIPGAVYHDALDPLATQIPDESGWPKPTRKRVGRWGSSWTYELTREQTEEMETYLRERAQSLMYAADPDPVYRTTLKTCERIRAVLDA